MVKTLVAISRSLRRAWLFELAGCVAIISGLYVAWGGAAAAIGAGVAALVKSAEIDG